MTLNWPDVLVACIHAGPATLTVLWTSWRQTKRLRHIERASNGQLHAKDIQIAALRKEIVELEKLIPPNA